jgi:Putative MetA-pathway of phenol degradation
MAYGKLMPSPSFWRRILLRASRTIVAVPLLLLPAVALGQGGPPLQTDDPGTPGNRNWEINVGFTADRESTANSYETPILDLNYGLGDRIQLKFEIPYLLQSTNTTPVQSGLGNSLLGVKWRFYENKKYGWDISTYPQLEWNNPTSSLRRGFVAGAPNFLLPLEVTKKLGPITMDGEVGYWFNSYASNGRILGLAVGHQQTTKLELLGEVYNQVQVRGTERETTFDFGGRYEFHHGLLLLFMAGRSFHGPASGQAQLIGYLGLQILIEHGKPTKD